MLWAYQHTPHESTGEKPSFLLYGMGCRAPTEAALLPAEEVEPADIVDYRQELVLALSHAQELATESIQGAQTRCKPAYDRMSHTQTYQIGEWVLIRFPHDETGANCNRRVTGTTETGVTAVKAYYPDEAPIHVHQSRVS